MVNGYFIAALAGLLVVEAINWTARLLNLRALSPELPAEFADVYDAEAYRRSQEYTRVNTRFQLRREHVRPGRAAGLLARGRLRLAGRGGARLAPQPDLDGAASSSSSWSPREGILGLPFSIYGTFVIEERFGFNRTTPATFVLDLLKGTGRRGGHRRAAHGRLPRPVHVRGPVRLDLRLGGRGRLLASSCRSSPRRLIMPLFNKFTPLADGELKDAILAYAKRVDFPLKGLFSIDASRRSSKGNAFFTGFGKRKRIALFDTLIERHSTEELVAVLAHEVGHYKKRHVLIGTIASALETGLFLGLFSVFLHQTGSVHGLRRRHARRLDRGGLRVDPAAAAGIGAVGGRRGPVAAARAAGRPVRRGDHRARRPAGVRAQAPVEGQPQQPHAASVLRVPQLLASAHAGAGEGAGGGSAPAARRAVSRAAAAPAGRIRIGRTRQNAGPSESREEGT